MLVLALAFWGFAEATLFFVVPDVLLIAVVGMPYWLFLLITPIARLPRFLMVSLLAGAFARVWGRWLSLRAMYAIWFVAWVAVYFVFWSS